MNHPRVVGMKIAVLSLADIDNYGDTFFPYMFRAELLKRLPKARIDLFTNIPFDSGIYRTQAYSPEAVADYDAIILAGGDTIQRLDQEEFGPIYAKLSSNVFSGRPSDIVFSWLELQKPFKAWFAVGAHPNILNYRTDVEEAFAKLDYLAVRGIIAKKILENNLICNNEKILIVPDLGWLFPEYINATKLKPKAILRKHGGPKIPSRPYAVFETYQEKDVPVERIAQTLIDFQEKSGVRILLVPFIRPWSDFKMLSQIYEASDGMLSLVPNTLSFLETGSVLKGSEFYIGASMHGAVTCLAYGKPAGNILRWTAPKLQDLHGMRSRTDCFANEWEQLGPMLDMLNQEKKSGKAERAAYSSYMRSRLCREIDGLAKRILEYTGRSV